MKTLVFIANWSGIAVIISGLYCLSGHAFVTDYIY